MIELEDRVLKFRNSFPKKDLYDLMAKHDQIVDYMVEQAENDRFIYNNYALYECFNKSLIATREECKKHDDEYQRWLIIFDMMGQYAKLRVFY